MLCTCDFSSLNSSSSSYRRLPPGVDSSSFMDSSWITDSYLPVSREFSYFCPGTTTDAFIFYFLPESCSLLPKLKSFLGSTKLDPTVILLSFSTAPLRSNPSYLVSD